MGSLPRFLEPRSWINQDIHLFHGTLDLHVDGIQRQVDVARGKTGTDFGRDFYTTTIRRQARVWAWQIAEKYNAAREDQESEALPVVIRFRVSRDKLANLDTLVFLRGAPKAEDYWSFVHHCRSGFAGHERDCESLVGEGWYDIVMGPAAAAWRTRLAILGSDQISFHTERAARVLSESRKRIEKVEG